MTPSEALLAGRKMVRRNSRAEAYIQFEGNDPNKRPVAACANGMLVLGYGLLGEWVTVDTDSLLVAHEPKLGAPARCPVRGCSLNRRLAYFSVADAVQHLNDLHRWSIPRIASWLAETVA